jgi:uncharacterized protein YaaQ
MSQQGVISEHTWQRLSPLLEKRTAALAEAVKEVITSDPVVENEEIDTVRREALRAQRAALTGLWRDGVISEEIYSQLVGEVDEALTENSTAWSELGTLSAAPALKVNRLMTAIVQEQDAENAVQALTRLRYTVTRIPSRGGFIRRGNVTLIVGMPAGLEEAAIRVLKNSCKQRIEFVSNLLPNAGFPAPAPIEVTVGGATIFVFDVESYVEF